MKKMHGCQWLMAGLTLLYTMIIAFSFLVALVAAGLRISDAAGWGILAGWVLICFLSVFFRPGFYLFFRSRVRMPLMAEKEKLWNCFREVLERADRPGDYRLRIEEIKELNAFAIGLRTIAVSRGILEALSEEELKGVMAHELGHLVSRDTLFGCAYAMAGKLPRFAAFICLKGARILRGEFSRPVMNTGGIPAIQRSIGHGLLWVLLITGLLYWLHLLALILLLTAFVLLFSLYNRVFGFCRSVLSRFIEYKQDAYAHRLGYGSGLQEALLRLTAESDFPVNSYEVIMHQEHPVIYNRIRRLEELQKTHNEDLRNN